MHPEEYHNADKEMITHLRLQLHHEKCRREQAELYVKLLKEEIKVLCQNKELKHDSWVPQPHARGNTTGVWTAYLCPWRLNI